MASSNQQPSSSSTAPQPPVLDITYKLLYHSIQGQDAGDCSYSTDHVHLALDTTSRLQPRMPSTSNFIVCKVYFSWTKYSGEMSGAYDQVEDTLISTRLLKETLRKDPDPVYCAISDMKITLFKERNQDGTVVGNGGRYVRLDVQMAGTPALSVRIWGKRLIGEDYAEAVLLSGEEKLRLGIEGRQWRWQAD